MKPGRLAIVEAPGVAAGIGVRQAACPKSTVFRSNSGNGVRGTGWETFVIQREILSRYALDDRYNRYKSIHREIATIVKCARHLFVCVRITHPRFGVKPCHCGNPAAS
jgi:hypothetical protein